MRISYINAKYGFDQVVTAPLTCAIQKIAGGTLLLKQWGSKLTPEHADREYLVELNPLDVQDIVRLGHENDMYEPHIIVYRPHYALHNKTQYIGPFPSLQSAYDYMVDHVPALGVQGPHPTEGVWSDTPGVRFIESLRKAFRDPAELRAEYERVLKDPIAK